MKPNVIVALLVGFVLGFAVRVAYDGTSSRSGAPQVVVASPPAPSGGLEAALAIKSSDFPGETFAGLSDSQKYAAMKVLNDNQCDCGCPNDTLAECAKKDPNCPNAPAKLRQAVELARAGKSAAQIQAEMFAGAPKGPTRAETAKPAPAAAGAAAGARIDVPPDSPSRGPKSAKVTIVVWSDFQCPYCKAAVPTVKQIEQAYGESVRVVFRHQPLPMHPNAKIAAEASMAAHEQGKFWEFHDKLFSNQSALDRPALEQYAGEMGLDVSKFKAALDTARFRAKVEADAAAGAAVGASGTPTFFINGRQLVGAVPFENFKAMIDEELVKASKLIASGVKPEKLYEKLLEQNGAPSAGANAAPPVAKMELGQAPVRGAKNAPVTIVEFSDFQCPYCRNAVPTLHELEKQYGNKVKVAFKHQPLPFHNNARLAAVASVAAQEQGKFWEYHDKLFANQQALDRASLERYAGEVGLNVGKFKSALDSKKLEARVDADVAEAQRSGVQGTPTFFINGRQVVGAQPIERFRALIDEELSKSNARTPEEPKKTAKK